MAISKRSMSRTNKSRVLFNQRSNSMFRSFGIMAAIAILVNVVILGFLGWVIVKLLQHFGVI